MTNKQIRELQLKNVKLREGRHDDDIDGAAQYQMSKNEEKIDKLLGIIKLYE